MARLLARQYPRAKVTGLDFNDGFIRYAAGRAKAEALSNIEFSQGDVRQLPFEDATFDTVWVHFLLYFVPHPAQAIHEFHRVLKPSGKLICVHNYRTLLTNYPENESLQSRTTKVADCIGDVHIAHKVPLFCHQAGFHDITNDVQSDPIYNIMGRAAPEQRENLEVILSSGLDRFALVLGSRAEAERFLADLLAYVDRPDTFSFNTSWITQAIA